MAKSIVITGGFGFIGSTLVEHLNKCGIVPYIIEDQENIGEKWRNVVGLRFNLLDGVDDINSIDGPVSMIHLGARVDTREKMNRDLWHNNVTFTTQLFKTCQEYQIIDKFIYASSGSVYGNEESDFSERIEGLRPTNAYAATKLVLDTHFFGDPRTCKSLRVYGLRFFNVYGGEREQAKGDMASLVYKGLTKQSPFYRDGKWKLFKSCRSDIKDGNQKRDFVAVWDVCKVIDFFLESDAQSGVYNVGSGVARTFNDLVKNIDSNIPTDYVEMPDVLRPQYQYHTCANLTKLREVAGYKEPFMTLEEGIEKTRECLKVNG